MRMKKMKRSGKGVMARGEDSFIGNSILDRFFSKNLKRENNYFNFELKMATSLSHHCKHMPLAMMEAKGRCAWLRVRVWATFSSSRLVEKAMMAWQTYKSTTINKSKYFSQNQLAIQN